MSKARSNSWIPLADYSTKYNVSVSTLRRKIRGNSIGFKLDNGKYFVTDEPPDKVLKTKSLGRSESDASGIDFIEDVKVSSKKSDKRAEESLNQKAASNISTTTTELGAFAASAQVLNQMSVDGYGERPEAARPQLKENVLTTANTLLEEIKKAYRMVLQEKEEMICQLREEISDLRTLTRVLESENERLKNR